jgi:type IV secretory pathway TrbD component
LIQFGVYVWIVTIVLGKMSTINRLEQRLRKLSTSDAAFEGTISCCSAWPCRKNFISILLFSPMLICFTGMDSETQAVIAAQCSPDVWRAMTMDDLQVHAGRGVEDSSGLFRRITCFRHQLWIAIETLRI